MRKQTNRVFSILLTLVMLLGMLPAPAQAAGRDPVIEIPATLAFTTKPQSGTALNTEDYTVTWATNKKPDLLLLQIMVTNRQGITWANVGAAVEPTGASGTITVEYPSAAERRPNEQSTYRLTVGYQGTEAETATCTFTVTWTEQTYTVTVNGGSGSGDYAEGKPVTITADEPASGKEFKEWDGGEDLTFTVGSATSATATFTMPAEAVELTATYQRIKPDTTPVRPEGDGTSGNPFEIGTVGELYWFAGFTNNYVAVNDTFDVERNKAHAILMNDITVNPDLLTDSYDLGVEASLLASWSPISYLEPYCGTFDGNGHTISGLYYCEISSFQTFAFIAEMGEGGVIKNLTLEDTYFYPELNSYFSTDMPFAAGIVGIAGEGTVENCHFDGVVGAGSTSYYGGGAGGIAWSTRGVIQNCTAKGRVIGQASFDDNAGGAKVGGIVGAAYGTAVVSDCINNAEVTCWDNDTAWGSAGGIVGYLAGTVRDCCNRGVISGQENNYAGGIVGRAAGEADQYAVISRCWNEANFTGSGIVDYIHSEINREGYTIVKNCYNAGSVTNGIVGKGWGDDISIAYCHNWGTVTDAPIYMVKYVGDTTVVENCFYRDIGETDSMDGTTFKTTEEFASSHGFVTKMLNAGNNGNWKQGGDYPILNKMFTLTVNGGTGSGVYGEGTEVAISATVPDGYLFAGWDGLDGLIVSAGNATTATVTFTMPAKPVTVTATYENAYIKRGDISAVTATATIDPVLGATTSAVSFTITEPTDAAAKGVIFSGNSWYKKDASSIYGWTQCSNGVDTFEEGTYRLSVQLRSKSNDAKEYYAMSGDTTFTVNGVQWNSEEPFRDYYATGGYGYRYFVSPEFTLGGKTLDSIAVTTPPTKTVYREGEDFNTAGMVVTATYTDSTTAPVISYTVTDGADMAAGKTTVTISYTEGGATKTTTQAITVAKEYNVTVNGGTGNGKYVAGEEVTISAFVAGGRKFKEWQGAEGLTFTSGDKNSQTAKFTMPARDVTVTAVTGHAEYYVSVSGGSGTGMYETGETVTIVADPPEAGKQFKEWSVGDGKVLNFTESDITSPTAKFVMPGEAVRIEATYEDIPVPKTPIDTVNISGLAKPVVGEMPDNSITVSGTGVTVDVEGSYWGRFDSPSFSPVYDDDTAVDSVAFRDGETYMFQLWLYAEDGYEFTEDSKFVFSGKELPALDMTDLSKTGAMVNPEDSTEALIYINMNDVPGAAATTLSGSVTFAGTSATARVTVENLYDSEAILIIAQYSGGQMKAVQTVSVTADGTFVPTAPFTHAEGCTYKAFLVNADTYAPLCAAAPLSE